MFACSEALVPFMSPLPPSLRQAFPLASFTLNSISVFTLVDRLSPCHPPPCNCRTRPHPVPQLHPYTLPYPEPLRPLPPSSAVASPSPISAPSPSHINVPSASLPSPRGRRQEPGRDRHPLGAAARPSVMESATLATSAVYINVHALPTPELALSLFWLCYHPYLCIRLSLSLSFFLFSFPAAFAPSLSLALFVSRLSSPSLSFIPTTLNPSELFFLVVLSSWRIHISLGDLISPLFLLFLSLPPSLSSPTFKFTIQKNLYPERSSLQQNFGYLKLLRGSGLLPDFARLNFGSPSPR